MSEGAPNMTSVMSDLNATSTAPPASLDALPPRAREALLAIARPAAFRAGATIMGEGTRGDSFYLVTRGQVKMCRLTPAGRNLILSLFGPGELFGVTPALSGERCTATWEAAVPCQCLQVRRTDLYALFSRRPELVAEILPWLTRHLVECRNCLVETSCARVESRFASLFLGLAAKIGEATEGGWLVPLALSRQELADFTGTTVETAIRVMSRWSKEHVVTTCRQGFVLHDRPGLETIAQA